MTDTSPEIERMMHERIMSLTGEERMLMGFSMFEVARDMALASFPPGLSKAEIRRRLFERFYPEEPLTPGLLAAFEAAG
jgi:hypothetical protein